MFPLRTENQKNRECKKGLFIKAEILELLDPFRVINTRIRGGKESMGESFSIDLSIVVISMKKKSPLRNLQSIAFEQINLRGR